MSFQFFILRKKQQISSSNYYLFYNVLKIRVVVSHCLLHFNFSATQLYFWTVCTGVKKVGIRYISILKSVWGISPAHRVIQQRANPKQEH